MSTNLTPPFEFDISLFDECMNHAASGRILHGLPDESDCNNIKWYFERKERKIISETVGLADR